MTDEGNNYINLFTILYSVSKYFRNPNQIAIIDIPEKIKYIVDNT